MAEYDDERPDFDAAFGDEPPEPKDEERGGALRRFTRPRRRLPGDEEGDVTGTGEISPPTAPGAPRERDDRPYVGRASRSRGISRPSSRGANARARARIGKDEPDPQPRRGGGSRRRGGGGRRGSSGGGAAVLQQPRARLLLLAAFAVIVAVILVLVVKDCQRSQLEDSYTTYVNSVAQINNDSADQGKQMRTILNNTKGQLPAQLRQQLGNLAEQADGLVTRANDLDPPGKMRTAQEGLVTALQYRADGVRKLADGLEAILKYDTTNAKAAGLAVPMQVLLASDVIYSQSFAPAAATALKDDDITGLKVPELAAFLPNTAWASPAGAERLIGPLGRRASGDGTTTSGETGLLRGTNLVGVVAQPSGTRLKPGEAVEISSDEGLSWEVTVHNGGESDEDGIVVSATWSYSSSPNDADKKEAQLPAVPAGEDATVTVPGPTDRKIGETGTLKINVSPVDGETKVDNNSAEYLVTINF
ncbi:MAG: hypothetical protein AB7V42_12750 [Thermoleophilia bacterium]